MAAQEVFSWVTLEVGKIVVVRGATQGLFFIWVKEKISRRFIEFAVLVFKSLSLVFWIVVRGLKMSIWFLGCLSSSGFLDSRRRT